MVKVNYSNRHGVSISYKVYRFFVGKVVWLCPGGSLLAEASGIIKVCFVVVFRQTCICVVPFLQVSRDIETFTMKPYSFVSYSFVSIYMV